MENLGYHNIHLSLLAQPRRNITIQGLSCPYGVVTKSDSGTESDTEKDTMDVNGTETIDMHYNLLSVGI